MIPTELPRFLKIKTALCNGPIDSAWHAFFRVEFQQNEYFNGWAPDWLTKLQDAAVETAATQAKPAFAG